ncbi:DUF1127 domain-containing protein [Gymnodinialimonas sp. 2305UL16-5]|uniref:DUF1127 domain-containing protein n=1 Tax=Gymnodinialimonas mytili TaxID=3126503 RepID=UPI00309ED313
MGDLSLFRPAAGATNGGPQLTKVVTRSSFWARLGAAWRQRRQLERLDARMLRDIGLTEADVHREMGRPLWDAPHPWRL